MLWNWNTINSCFLSQKFRIKSAGGMAAACISVLLLAFILEGFRRAVKEYDRHLVHRHLQKKYRLKQQGKNGLGGLDINLADARAFNSGFEQLVRTLLMTVTFILAYLLMLLGMYYNGYILICIFLGVFFGIFAFTWGHLAGSMGETTVCCG
ncbi:Ctr copper transporter [Cladorrhinum sp. PSN259]|nr:Ctr copper transporter [Cladorrhinum sp. PSN259]